MPPVVLDSGCNRYRHRYRGSKPVGTSTGGVSSLTSGNGCDRRRFLRVAGGLMAVGVTGLLGACSPVGPSAPSAPGPAGAGATPAAASGAKLANLLPTYIPAAGAPKADLPSTGPGIDDAWINFPKQAFKSVHDT